MDIKVVAYFLGRIAQAEGLIFLVPLAVSLWYAESSCAALLLTSALSAAAGTALRRFGKAPGERLSLREGIAITGVGWLLATFLGMLPYLLGGYLGYLDGVFESISGFTGTGATVIEDIEAMPQGVLLWRSLTHWLGGLGIIVIFIALLPATGQSAITMYNAESSAQGSERVLPRLKDLTAVLFRIYVVLTGAAFLAFFLCGMNALDAVNHAMSTIGTGGFSTYNASAAHFESPAIELWMSLFMFISGGSFGLYYRVYKKGPQVLWRNSEFKAYLGIVGGAVLLIAANLFYRGLYNVPDALRFALFQATSLSTTGFVSADYELWPGFSKGILLLLMLTGGCVGSTAAGLKISRILLLFRMVRTIVLEKLHPRVTTPVRINGASVDEATLHRTAVFFFLYVLSIAFFAVLMTADNIKTFDAIGISVTTVGCVGPAFGVAGATENYAGLSDFTKGILCFAMLLGRLEFFTLLVMLYPSFWRSKKNW